MPHDLCAGLAICPGNVYITENHKDKNKAMVCQVFRIFSILIIWLMYSSAHANLYHDSNLNWKTIETVHFWFHYHDGVEPLVRAFLPRAKAIHEQVTDYLDWVPENKTHVVFTDEYDISNGWATIFPWANTHIFLAAPDDIHSLEDHDGWLDTVFLHEYVHIVHLDKARGVPLVIRGIFGREGLVFPTAFPNAYQPAWVIEGLATYRETDHAAGIGRGQSSYFDMLMRMELEGGLKPLRQVNQPLGSWPAGTTRYLYGVNFFEFAHDRYGDEKIQAMVENFSDNFVPYRIGSNAYQTFGKDLDQLWTEFADYLKVRHAPTFARVKQQGLVAGKKISQQGYRAESLRALQERVYYVGFNGEHHSAIMTTTGDAAPEKLHDIHYGARLSLHEQQGILISQPEVCRNARIYYDLYRLNFDGSGYRRLTRCQRYRQAIWNQQGDRIYAVHNQLGINSLQVLDAQGHQLDTLWTGEQEEQISQMSYSPVSDVIVAGVWRKGLGWNLELFDIKQRQWKALTHNNSIEAHPNFSQDGKSVIFTADYNGVYNVYRLPLDQPRLQQLTNLTGGAFYPAMTQQGLYYLGANPQGFDLYHLSQPAVLARPAAVKSAAKPAARQVATNTAQPDYPAEDYSPWESLRPSWWLPYFFIDDQKEEYGIQTFGNDALQRHLYSTFIAYDAANDWLTGNLDYFYDGLWPVLHFGLSRETALFLDAGNNPARVRVEKQLLLEAIFPFTSFSDTLFVHAALSTEREKDGWRAAGISPAQDTREDFLGLGLRYISAKRYPLSVSRNEGRELRLIYEDTDAFGNSDRKGQILVGEWREFIPVSGEQVLALRLVEGHGDANSIPFRLGGIQSDNPFVFGQGGIAPIFDEHDYPLRGYDEGISILSGQNLRLFSVEYRFPLWRIERGWMAPPLGINQIHANVFYDAGGVWADNQSGPDKYYAGAGFELNTDLDLLYEFRLNLSLGYAHGFDDVLGEDKYYLRVGSQF